MVLSSPTYMASTQIRLKSAFCHNWALLHYGGVGIPLVYGALPPLSLGFSVLSNGVHGIPPPFPLPPLAKNKKSTKLKQGLLQCRQAKAGRASPKGLGPSLPSTLGLDLPAEPQIIRFGAV